jgi:hypothetical protein
MDTAIALADNYLEEFSTVKESADSLVRWQTTKAGTAGFLFNCAGSLAVPAMLPANMATALFLQLRMSAAIAYMGHHDLYSDRVKVFIYACLCGNMALDVMRSAGIDFSVAYTKRAILAVPDSAIAEINKYVGLKLVTKYGNGLVNLGKLAPVVGGFAGGAIDAFSTRAIGSVAKRVFIP